MFDFQAEILHKGLDLSNDPSNIIKIYDDTA